MADNKDAPSANFQRLNPEQIAAAGRAGLAILGHEACVIPNSVRKQVDTLEQILAGLAQGSLVVGVEQQATESEQTPESGEEASDSGKSQGSNRGRRSRAKK